MELIDKTALVAEVERRQKIHFNDYHINGNGSPADYGACNALTQILDFINTLEVKEVEEKFEHPNIKAKDAVEVSSRMPHIDKRLLPIAEFIMDYASWNLHKDEWNQPVLEVPLFRVLDALVQKGKPYCEG